MVRAGDGILDGADEGFDIVERDGAHGGDLENAVGERAFSAVDDEPAVAEGGAQEVKAGAVGEVDGRNGVRENVVGVEEGQADVFEACSEELGFFCLVGESILHAFFGDHFEGFVEGNKEMDGRGIGGLEFVVGEGEVPCETEIIVPHGVVGEFFKFVGFSDDEGEAWGHAEGFSA